MRPARPSERSRSSGPWVNSAGPREPTWYQGMFAVADGRFDLAAVFYEQSLRTWMQSESSSRWFKPLVGLADVAAAHRTVSPLSARLLGAADEMMAVSGRVLMPFDKPGYERARDACQRALDPIASTRLSPKDGACRPRSGSTNPAPSSTTRDNTRCRVDEARSDRHVERLPYSSENGDFEPAPSR